MKIRQARIDDASKIRQIAKTHYFTNPNSERTSGFFNFMPPLDNYINFVKDNPYSLIAEGEEGNIEGFMTAADDKKILYFSSLEKDVVLDKILTFKKPFIYVEEIAAREPGTFLGAKAVTSLMKRLLEISNLNDMQSIFGVIMYSPWRNIISENFVKKFDFNKVGQVENPSEEILNIFQRKETYSL